MSSQGRKRIVRAQPKKSEETIIRDILKLQKELMFKHRTASLFTFRSKHGQLEFGTKNVVDKFKEDFDNEWEAAFNDDEDELIESIQIDADNDIDAFNHARGTLIAKKLPADLNLMIYGELWAWITEETLKQHWLSGGDFRCVKFGHPDFEPTFWLGELWAWQEVIKHPNNLPRFAYTGPGNMTQFLKKVVKNRLDMLGINHNNWVYESFSEEERTKREKSKKKSHPSDLVTTGGEVNNSYPDSSDEIANNDMGTQDEGNDNADGVSDIIGGDEEQNVVHDATQDETVLHDPTQDETLVHDTDESGLSNILKNNGIDLQNISSLNVSSIGDTFPNATSSVSGHTNIPRRFSARQATQHARQTERL